MAETGKTMASWLLIVVLWLASIVLALQSVAQHGGLIPGLKVLFSSQMPDAQAVILHSMWFPRQVMAWLGGSGLALCGWLMQRASAAGNHIEATPKASVAPEVIPLWLADAAGAA